MPDRQIVGLGGAGSTEEETRRLLAYVVGLAGKPSPKVCFVPTAGADDAGSVLRIYGLLPEEARTSHLPFFPWPPKDLRGFALEQDVIFIAGGNAVNALASWRAHRFDDIPSKDQAAEVVVTR